MNSIFATTEKLSSGFVQPSRRNSIHGVNLCGSRISVPLLHLNSAMSGPLSSKWVAKE